ncbi:dihydropteroate synthase [Maridesulfovibrio bastinii]|uniref:dihydropteroate synthase n=1 Tax=Maridesulfovibrio bastinii TaxID=47157 RepID=UPI000481F368|nr:dihydropteroate synthase [Maridesulfovibrio bastinii]
MLKEYTWTVRGGRVLGPAPFLVAGIVNVTPDSFYDGGTHDTTESAVKHALKLIADGADMLDIGGESSRPFSDKVSVAEELARVLPLVEKLSPDYVVSVDTIKSEVARQCIEAGAHIINDVSAFTYDPELLEVVGHYKPGYVLMHTKGQSDTMQVDPRYDDVVENILTFFKKSLEKLNKAGLPDDYIVLDPGIGFGKTLEHNLEILKNIDRFMDLGFPVYMGLSNKSLFKGLLDLEVGDRKNATQAATACLAARSVPIHRVHEVRETCQTLAIVKELFGDK